MTAVAYFNLTLEEYLKAPTGTAGRRTKIGVMPYTFTVSCVDNQGTNGTEPARDRRYAVLATPIGGDKPWRSKLVNEQEFRKAVGTLIPEKQLSLLKATGPGQGIASGNGPGEILFSFEEITGMGLPEDRN